MSDQLPMMPHDMRMLPAVACPNCGSPAGIEQDEHGRRYCQDCDWRSPDTGHPV